MKPRSTFSLGRLRVRRSGYGAMQLAGPWAVNPPADQASAIDLLRAAITAGIDHIDTAQYYGPDLVNDLIREALHPYPPELAIVSPVVIQTAARLGVTPPRVALQWLLQLAPNVLLIPGTASVAHLLDNLTAEDVVLDDQALRQLDGVSA